MDTKKFEIIMQLMEELKEEMQPSGDELGMRLGRKKPEVDAVKMEIEAEPMEIGEDEGDEMAMMEEGPEDALKSRIMKMRG